MLDVWYALSPIDVAPVLSRDERQRRDQFVDAAARQRYERAHGLKRVVLAHYAAGCAPQDLRFTRGRCGKPEADQPFPYRFNMSHSAHCIAIAVAADDVGVDIEWHRPIVASASLARCVFDTEERRWLARQACFDEAFFRLWTLKEALLKALGTGWTDDFDWQQIEVGAKASGAPSVRLNGNVLALANSIPVRKIHVSLSHTTHLAFAEVILEGGETEAVGGMKK